MNKQSSRTSLFLIELVLSIFFFIVAASICMQLFVNTYFLSQETIETNQALLWSQNLAEPFLGHMGDSSFVKNLYSDVDCASELSTNPDSSILLCFDKDWNSIKTLSECKYLVYSIFYTDETFAYQDIYIAKYHESLSSMQSATEIAELLCEDNYKIYQLTIKKYIP